MKSVLNEENINHTTCSDPPAQQTQGRAEKFHQLFKTPDSPTGSISISC